ncbi:SURF1 family protein [Phyllobacterium sp. 22552]|uniref:SURF1 family protein n=1 Tax=Phyllobacterium sp. 22552 TaxID=3453941 RepID=UPI003F85440B
MNTSPNIMERRRFPWVMLILGSIVFFILIALGTWQVERLQWKENLLAEIEQRTHTPPASLTEIESLWAEKHDIDYRPVTVTGQFLHGQERHYFATFAGMSGFYVYAPLQMIDGRIIFVNRGFVPYDKKEPSSRGSSIEGPVAVRGLARNPLDAKPSSIVPDNDLKANIYYWKDLPVMAAQSGVPTDKLVPFFVDADKTPNPGGLPIGGVTIIDLPNSHLQYAVTWYGLAATLLAIAGISVWRRTHPKEEPVQSNSSGLTSR